MPFNLFFCFYSILSEEGSNLVYKHQEGTKSWVGFCPHGALAGFVHQVGLSLVRRVTSCPFIPDWCWGLSQDDGGEVVTGRAAWRQEVGAFTCLWYLVTLQSSP